MERRKSDRQQSGHRTRTALRKCKYYAAHLSPYRQPYGQTLQLTPALALAVEAGHSFA
jgi:hypothetical protein